MFMNFVMSMIKAFLFDMDGVLLDSEDIYLRSLVKCLASIGICEDKHHLSDLTGMKSELITKTLMKRYDISDMSAEELMHLQDVYFDREVEKSELVSMEGLVDFLDALKAGNMKIALASSSDQAWISQVIDTLQIRSYFDVIISAEQITHSKPDPESFLTAASRLGVTPSQCVVIEDSQNGIMAGKQAGMLVIGFKGSVVWQNTSCADMEVHSFREIQLEDVENYVRQ